MPRKRRSLEIPYQRGAWPPRSASDTARDAAERLQRELKTFRISSDVNSGKGVAFISVWAELIVWTDGSSGYWWWSGRLSLSMRKIYAWVPVHDCASAARRVARRLAETSASHPHSAAIVEMPDAVKDGWEIPDLGRHAMHGGHRMPLIEPV